MNSRSELLIGPDLFKQFRQGLGARLGRGLLDCQEVLALLLGMHGCLGERFGDDGRLVELYPKSKMD